jgi:peptidyl-tRNA hydrolase, PTH1 family
VYLFAGLGNIGSEYAHTRHNIGFDIVDVLEPKLARSTGWKAGKGSYYFAKGWHKNEEVLLIKPTTYMNLSGRAVRDALQFYKVDFENLVVICDDIAIPTGTLRLRMSGSDGGHNGLTSIIFETGREDFARLRCGVGADFARGQQANYVLSPFKTSEKDIVNQMIDRAVIGCLTIVEQGVEKAMNVVNAKSE